MICKILRNSVLPSPLRNIRITNFGPQIFTNSFAGLFLLFALLSTKTTANYNSLALNPPLRHQILQPKCSLNGMPRGVQLRQFLHSNIRRKCQHIALVERRVSTIFNLLVHILLPTWVELKFREEPSTPACSDPGHNPALEILAHCGNVEGVAGGSLEVGC